MRVTMPINVGQEALGALDSFGPTQEGGRPDRARPEGCGREDRGQAAEAQASEAPRLDFYCTYRPTGWVWLFTKKIMEAVKSAYSFNRFSRRPPLLTLNGPNPTKNINGAGLGCAKGDLQGALLHGVTEDFERDLTNSEGRAEEDGPLIDLSLDVVPRVVIRDRNARDSLLLRLRERFMPQKYGARYRAPGHQDDISRWRLFDGIEAFVFRAWYDFVGRVNLLKHECGLNRPRRK